MAAVTVNGVAIPENAINAELSNLQSQGVPATPELREKVIGDLVVREVMVDEANKLKLDATPVFKQQLGELRQRLLMDSLFADYMVKNPITDADEKAEYLRQKKALGGADTTPQYQLSQIVVKTQEQADDLLARIKKGESFESLASNSIDAQSREHGGLIGWVFPNDILPSIAAVIPNVSKGSTAAAPIQSGAGWHIVKVDDVRPFKIPSFDESHQQLKQALINQRRQKLIESLLQKADIKRP